MNRILAKTTIRKSTYDIFGVRQIQDSETFGGHLVAPILEVDFYKEAKNMVLHLETDLPQEGIEETALFKSVVELNKHATLVSYKVLETNSEFEANKNVIEFIFDMK